MPAWFVRLLGDNPLFLLVVVLLLSYPLGRLRVGHVRLGISAMLFAGLAVGALHPSFRLPEIFYQFGLILFVYTVGLANGAAFFAALKRKGLRDNLLVLIVLIAAAVLTWAMARGWGFSGTLAAGMYAGGLTNTPALAAVLEAVRAAPLTPDIEARLAEPVMAYSVTYPMGVLGVILAIALCERLFRVDYAREAERHKIMGGIPRRLTNRTIRVLRAHPEKTVAGLIKAHRWRVACARLKRNDRLSVVTGKERLSEGDLISVVGAPEEVERVATALGEIAAERLEFERGEMDFRRIFVSNPRVAGYRLRDLNLPEEFGAVVTRVRRGDSVFVPTSETVLELGDRVRVVSRKENLDAVQNFFGDSYRASSEIDVLSFAVGLGLGILVGLAAVPIGKITLRLGLAGGPLVVALLLGRRRRSGPLVWALPYSANLTLRQLGLMLFLAGVGTRAGHTFAATFVSSGGLSIFLLGTALTFTTALALLWIGHKLLKIPMGMLIGMLSGMQTQPAVLAFAHERAHNDLPNVGYATVYPVAFIAKIILAQLLLVALG
ncbi:MAG: transporter [Vicinamibacteria bacterium]|jgi:putative transport protein|nr:transporter [Vicinamibacteria bacterium]